MDLKAAVRSAWSASLTAFNIAISLAIGVGILATGYLLIEEVARLFIERNVLDLIVKELNGGLTLAHAAALMVLGFVVYWFVRD
jgi:hypothetical protein